MYTKLLRGLKMEEALETKSEIDLRLSELEYLITTLRLWGEYSTEESKKDQSLSFCDLASEKLNQIQTLSNRLGKQLLA
jgi:hypothetical protein